MAMAMEMRVPSPLSFSSSRRQVSVDLHLRRLAVQAVSAPFLGANALSTSVVATREKGKNAKLISVLRTQGISSLELPLIEHKEGPDFERLPTFLRERSFEWIVITSPEAASVFLEGWKTAGSPEVRLAVVGSGTAEVFEDVLGSNLQVDFIPSKANAKTLVEELPKPAVDRGNVLYPASARASNELEKGLSARAFEVIRLNTYSTESVKVVDPTLVSLATSAPVVALASPTAVRAWVDLINIATWGGAAACIGQTSATAAKKAGLKKIFYPDNPGIDGWVQSILEALESQKRECAA